MPRNNRTVSVIIPAYNAEGSISSCIDSVLNQSFIGNITEIIIVNDGSVDNTLSIATSMKNNNKTSVTIKIIDQKNKGVSAARNAGITASKGEWVALLDSDDQWHVDKIKLSLKAIKVNPEIVTLGSNRKGFIRNHGRKVTGDIYKLSIRDELWMPWPTTSSLLIKRDAFEQVGMFDETRTHAEDVDLLLRLAPKFGVHYLYQPLLIFAEKASYGDSGLSANLLKMHKGSMQNVKNAKNRGDISWSEYIFFSLWEKVKYLRRIVKVKLGVAK